MHPTSSAQDGAASDSVVLDQFARNLVTIRKRFARDLPPDRPIDALSVVRVCRDIKLIVGTRLTRRNERKVRQGMGVGR